MAVASTTQARAKPPAAAIAMTAMVIAGAILPPPTADGHILHLPSVCVFQALTGLPCPFCGMTRSVVCIVHGRLAEGFHYHPLGPLILVLAAVVWVDSVLRWRTGAGLPPLSPRRRKMLTTALAAVVVVVAVVRDFLVATHRFVL